MKELGQYKILFRHEVETGFMMDTTIKRGYLIGHGPLTTPTVADQIVYPVVDNVIHDGHSLADTLPEEYSTPLENPEADPSRQACAATTATEDEFEAYSADTDFTVYLYHYQDASIRRDGCGYASKPIRSRDAFLELAKEVEALHDEEQKGFGPGEPTGPDIQTLDTFTE